MMIHKASVVIPAYCSEQTLPVLVPRLLEVLDRAGIEPEIILVDDASPDKTWSTCLDLKARYGRRLKIIRLATNRGQHNATLCGMAHASGDAVVTMDDDLQNPPEEVPALLEPLKHGYDLVIAEYPRTGGWAWKNLGGMLVDALLRRIFHLSPGFHLTSFRAVRRGVADEVCRMPAVYPYLTAMLLSHADRACNVPVRHEPRLCGTSGYGLRRSLELAANLIFNYSSCPLYLVALLCLGSLVFAVATSVFVLAKVVMEGIRVPGWASLMVMTAFFNAMLLLAMVIFGVYLTRLNEIVSRSRVRFTIGEIHE